MPLMSTPTKLSLALYYFDGCPFCDLVQMVLEDLRIDIEYRNIFSDRDHRTALIEARGRQTVPVLAITDAAGNVEWMGESRDIVAWLRARHAEGVLAPAMDGDREAGGQPI
jgi:glutaredoxin 2